jgi:hypothetical protein
MCARQQQEQGYKVTCCEPCRNAVGPDEGEKRHLSSKKTLGFIQSCDFYALQVRFTGRIYEE